MDRILRKTGDGSHTLYVKGLEEHYHSTHGALQESMHVFIKQGLLTIDLPTVNILELGFGTGLNALLTLREAQLNKQNIYYHAVDKYPLQESLYTSLNYDQYVTELPEGTLHLLHSCPWERDIRISDYFKIYKEEADFRSMNPSSGIHLIYFDAFSPDKQPELWTNEVMDKVGQLAEKGAILVTYSSKGAVRSTLDSCGFEVQKVQGPPGKREMIRARKR